MKTALVHCSYHKCLTVYFARVAGGLFDRCLPWSGGYRHYNSHLDEFYAGFRRNRVASVNNRAPDLERLAPCRVSRFVRDPRDLVVSGYFYHRRGAEPWTTAESPTDADWYFANGRVPRALRDRGGSFAAYLQSVTEEEGLLAELEFRTLHFDSMLEWPETHPDVATWRYEEVVGNETATFGQIFRFYGLPPATRWLGLWFARRHASRRRRPDAHVRDPSPGQWRKHFTSRVRQAFDARYAGLIARLGYPRD